MVTPQIVELIFSFGCRDRACFASRPAASLGMLYCSRRWFGGGLRSRTGVVDFNVRNLYRPDRPVIGLIARHAGNLLHQFDGGIVALAEDGVMAIQHIGMSAFESHFHDEELRAVGVRSGVGVGETAGTIENDGRRNFILELVAGITFAAAGGIPALNHEFWNHAMKDGAVIKRDAVLLGMRYGAGPIFGAAGEADKICDSDGSNFRKQGAVEIANRGMDDGGWFGRGSGGGWSGGSFRSRGGLRAGQKGCGDYQDKSLQQGSHGCS